MSCDIGICCAPCPHLVACNDMTGGRAHIVLPSRNLKRGAMKKPTKLLVVSDIHAGSKWAVCPLDAWVVETGGKPSRNAVMDWLTQCWQEFVDWAHPQLDGHDWTLLLNGDAIEGVHHGGREIWSDVATDHTDAAERLLRQLGKPSKSYIVQGTECHTRHEENRLAKDLGGVISPDGGAWPHLRLKVGDCIVSATHHIGTTSRAYLESNNLSAALGHEIIECDHGGWRTPDVVIRSHRHRHGVYSTGSKMILVTGAWQALTRHGHKVVPASLPRPTGHILTWQPGEKLPRVETFIRHPPEPDHQSL